MAELLVQHAYRRSRKRRQTGRTRAVCGKVSRLREGFSRNVLYSLAWIDGKARCSGSYDERGSVASNRLRSDEDLPSGFPFSSKGRPISVGPRLSKGRKLAFSCGSTYKYLLSLLALKKERHLRSLARPSIKSQIRFNVNCRRQNHLRKSSSCLRFLSDKSAHFRKKGDKTN